MIDDLIGKKVLIRTYSAGVWFGELKSFDGMKVRLTNARRCWRWYGASECSQLAMEGTSKPEDCKFPMPVTDLTLEAIEIHAMTDKAWKSLSEVKVWKS